MAEPPTEVFVYRKDKLLLRQALPPGDYLIGRGEAADLQITSGDVREQHARISLQREECSVVELKEGAPQQRAQQLSPEQPIAVGDITIVLQRVRTRGIAPPRTPATADDLPEEIRAARKYELGPQIARGGMGVILDAHEVPVQRNVAMKLIGDVAGRGEVERFVREAQVTAQLEHPNIVPVHELGVNQEGKPFYTMKYVRGVSLRRVLDLLAHGDPETVARYSLSELLLVLQKVCDAIAFAHSKGVIHRDLKPDNIMLGEYGEVLVMDWGLAKVLGEESHEITPPDEAAQENSTSPDVGAEDTVTQVGTVMGTLQYMPPEQACGKIDELDEAADIYALGAILHHVLTLRPPIDGQNTEQVLENVCAGRIRTLDGVRSTRALPHLRGGMIPESLRAVAKTAMASEPRQRYPSVKAFQSDVAAYQNGFATTAERASTWKRAVLFLRRHRTLSSAAAALLLAALLFTVNLAIARSRAEAAERIATEQRNAAENHLYVSDMLQAGSYIAENRSDSARELLERHRREVSGRDLRGWEWYYLHAQLNQDLLRTEAHTGGVHALAASPDGVNLATGGADGALAIWQARGLARKLHLPGAHQGTVLSVAWQSGGPMLASAGADGFVRIWNTDTGEKVAETRPGEGGEIRALAWQPLADGRGGIAIGGSDPAVYLWHPFVTQPTPPARVLFQTEHGTASLAWSADGGRLVAGRLDSEDTVQVFDLQRRSVSLGARLLVGNDVLSTAWSHSGKYIAAGSKHFSVAIFEPDAEHKLLSERNAHRGMVRSVSWSPDDELLASASEDGTIRLVRALESEALPVFLRGHIGEVTAIAWMKGGGEQILFSAGADGTLRAWRAVARDSAAFRLKHDNWIASTRWSPDGARVAGVDFRSVYLIDPAAGASLPLVSRLDRLFDVAWSPTGDRLLIADRKAGAVEMLETRSGRSLGIFASPQAEHVAWSRSGRYFMAAGGAEVSTWDAQSMQLITRIARPAGAVAWYPDEQHAVLGGNDGAVELWNVITGKSVALWRAPRSAPSGAIALKHDPPCKILALRMSPDGRLLAFGSADKSAGLLDRQTGKEVRAFAGHTGGVRGVAWSPDGRRLATCSQDGSARVFDVETGDLVARLEHGRGADEVHTIDWSPDGQQLVTGGYDCRVQFWDAARSFTAEEVQGLQRTSDRVPQDTALRRELARKYVRLGWLGRAREAAASDAALSATVEQELAQSLHSAPKEPRAPDTAAPLSAHGFALLNTIQDATEKGKAPVAVQAFQELAGLPEATSTLPLAAQYFSRLEWKTAWFPIGDGEQDDPTRWRSAAAGSSAVPLTMWSLCLPYNGRPPSELLLKPEDGKIMPATAPYGMIAHARLPSGGSKWRIRASGGGGVRVAADGKVLMERWNEEAPFDLSAEWEAAAGSDIQLVVEHFVSRSIPPRFEITMAPVTTSPAAAAVAPSASAQVGDP